MIKEVFASDETIASAKAKACEMLGEKEKNVDFEIIHQPSKKVLGMFGGKMAQVKASVKKTTGQKALEYIKEILFYMGLPDLKIDITSETEECCDIKIDGEAVNFVLGRHGETLDSLQYLSGLVANSSKTDSNFCKIRLEAGDYREKRKQVLLDLGKRTAKHALKTQKKLFLEPMRSYERKLIHVAVGEIEDVKSWSEGEGKYRHVVIAPNAWEDLA